LTLIDVAQLEGDIVVSDVEENILLRSAIPFIFADSPATSSPFGLVLPLSPLAYSLSLKESNEFRALSFFHSFSGLLLPPIFSAPYGRNSCAEFCE